MKVLIAAADPELTSKLAELLERLGLSAAVAGTLGEAAAQLRAGGFGAAVIDNALPGGGPEGFREVAGRAGGARVFLLVPEVTPESDEAAREAGAVAVPKADMRSLIERLEALAPGDREDWD